MESTPEFEAAIWPKFLAPPTYSEADPLWIDPRLPDFNLIWNTAKACGYAVGLHGSMKRDCDLIAVPWVENAKPHKDLIADLCKALDAIVLLSAERKAHNRVAVILQINGYYKPIDLSILTHHENTP